MVVSPPGRSAFSSASRRRSAAEGGGSPALLRRVDSRFLHGGGVARVPPSLWNKGAGALSLPRRRFSERFRRASGGLSPWIDRSVGVWCSTGGLHGEGGGRRRGLLSLVPAFVEVSLLLAILRGFWGWCDEVLVLRAGRHRRLYRRTLGSVLVGCSSSGVRDAEDGGSFCCFPSSTPSESGGARFQGVRGVSPAVFVQRYSSRRPCARRVSPLVPQMMLPWSLGVGFVWFASPALLFLCLFRIGRAHV